MAKVGKLLISPLYHIGKAILKKPKKPEIPDAPGVVTRNAAADAAMSEDALRRRRGQLGNDVTGGGAEASSPGGKTLLGQ